MVDLRITPSRSVGDGPGAEALRGKKLPAPQRARQERPTKERESPSVGPWGASPRLFVLRRHHAGLPMESECRRPVYPRFPGSPRRNLRFEDSRRGGRPREPSWRAQTPLLRGRAPSRRLPAMVQVSRRESTGISRRFPASTARRNPPPRPSARRLVAPSGGWDRSQHRSPRMGAITRVVEDARNARAGAAECGAAPRERARSREYAAVAALVRRDARDWVDSLALLHMGPVGLLHGHPSLPGRIMTRPPRWLDLLHRLGGPADATAGSNGVPGGAGGHQGVRRFWYTRDSTPSRTRRADSS